MSGPLKEKFLNDIYDLLTNHKYEIEWGTKESFARARLYWEDAEQRIDKFIEDIKREDNERL